MAKSVPLLAFKFQKGVLSPTLKKFFFMVVLGLLTGPTGLQAQVAYTGLIGGIDRGDGASLPTLGFKLSFDPQDGLEVTYARGGIRSEGSFFEKERLLSVTYRSVSSGTFDTLFGGGFGIVNSSSEAEGETESITNVAIALNYGLNWRFTDSFALKTGLDTFIIPIPTTNPLYSNGIRNLWFLGFEIGF